MDGANARITAEVTSWPGIEATTGSRGEWSFRLGKREIGHLHGDRVAHFGFPRAQWAELMASGRVTEHPVMHEGWAARDIADEDDLHDVVALLRLNYDRAVERHGLPEAA